MKVLLSHRTAAFATHNPVIRAKMLCSQHSSLPEDYALDLSSYEAARISERLNVNERVCCSTISSSERRNAVGFFSKLLPVSPRESSFVDLGRGIYAPCPELVFLEMASELSFVELIRFGFDLCGTYVPGHGGAKTKYGVEPLCQAGELVSFCESHRGAQFAEHALKAARHVLDNSASPAESILAIRFVLPKHYGGYGVVPPVLNELYAKEGSARFPDLYWENFGIDMEYDSGEFHSDVTRDAVRRNQLQPTLKVFTVTSEMGGRLDLLDGLSASFHKAAGLRYRVRVANYKTKKLALHRQLLEPEWYKQPASGAYRLVNAA